MNEYTENTFLTNDNTYVLRNKDVELCGDYFDVVPDGNLYTMNDSPIFAVRMRPMGIEHIMKIYRHKYGFNTVVLTYKIHTNQYTLYSDNSYQMYITQKDILLKYFNFSSLKNNEFNGVIIVVTNNDNRMIHAVPYLYGIVNDKKKIIFLDPFFAPDLGSGCIIGADFFYRVYNGDIDCYCHGETIQADHHSCGIIACDFVKNCLQNNAKLAFKILKSVIMRTEINNHDTGTKSYVNIFDLPNELKKFKQVRTEATYNKILSNIDDEKQKQNTKNWFSKHLKTLIYRKDPEPYNPDAMLVPENEGCKKSINTSLLEKGHKYAGMIVKDLKQDMKYNSKYWLSVIKEQNDGNFLKKMLLRTKNLIKFYQQNDKI